MATWSLLHSHIFFISNCASILWPYSHSLPSRAPLERNSCFWSTKGAGSRPEGSASLLGNETGVAARSAIPK